MSKILVGQYLNHPESEGLAVDSAATLSVTDDIVQLGFSTEAIAVKEQFAFWADMVAKITSEISVKPHKYYQSSRGFQGEISIIAVDDMVMTIGYSDFLRYSCSISADRDSEDIGLVVMFPLDNLSRNINSYARINELPISAGMVYFADDRHADVSEVHDGRLLTLRLPLCKSDFIECGKIFPSPFAMTLALQHHPLYCYLREQLRALAQYHTHTSPRILSVMMQNVRKILVAILHELVDEILAKRGCIALSSAQHERIYYQAQQYIKTHFCAPLSAECIAKAVNCSRATLYRAFSRHETSISQYINQLRLEKLRQQLLKSDTQTLQQICEQCGFKNSAYAGQLFKQHFDMTMGEWRALMMGRNI